MFHYDAELRPWSHEQTFCAPCRALLASSSSRTDSKESRLAINSDKGPLPSKQARKVAGRNETMCRSFGTNGERFGPKRKTRNARHVVRTMKSRNVSRGALEVTCGYDERTTREHPAICG